MHESYPKTARKDHPLSCCLRNLTVMASCLSSAQTDVFFFDGNAAKRCYAVPALKGTTNELRATLHSKVRTSFLRFGHTKRC